MAVRGVGGEGGGGAEGRQSVVFLSVCLLWEGVGLGDFACFH